MARVLRYRLFPESKPGKGYVIVHSNRYVGQYVDVIGAGRVFTVKIFRNKKSANSFIRGCKKRKDFDKCIFRMNKRG